MGGESITRSCSAQNEGAGAVIKLGEVVMILDLHRQGLTVSAIARELGIDRKTVRKCIARGLEPPVYGPRKPRQRRIDPFVSYSRERVTAYPGLTGRRLLRELRERGYEGGYTAVTAVLREIRLASRRRRVTRRRSTLPNSRCSSLMNRRSPASSGCSPLCSASAG
jgi:transposase